jgi:hypothetical protein
MPSLKNISKFFLNTRVIGDGHKKKSHTVTSGAVLEKKHENKRDEDNLQGLCSCYAHNAKKTYSTRHFDEHTSFIN